MPSHSKKQHNFMEAVAHSPSFAKKAGVPQSVGKDFAAADKGKTFKHGGEMKESKAMVGKEVAFMKKKGAPKSMLKHEESEMKGMKAGGKVRRMAMGGQGDSSYMTDEDYEKQKEQGEKNWKSVKNFFGFGEKEPAPIEERTPPKSAKTESVKEFITPTRISSSDLSSAPSKRDERPVFTGMGTFEDNAEPQRGTQTGSGAFGFPSNYKDSGFSALENKPQRNKPTTVSRTRETTSVTTGRPATGKSDSSYDAIERNRANKSPSSMLSKLRKESEDKIRDSKPGSMTKQMREAPTINELYRGQKSMSDEIDDLLKSFRSKIRGGLKSGEEKRKLREEEQHIAKGGKVKAYAQGGRVKKMAFGGTNIMMPPQTNNTQSTNTPPASQTVPNVPAGVPAGVTPMPYVQLPKPVTKPAVTLPNPYIKEQQAKAAADFRAKRAAEIATPEYKAQQAKEAADYRAKMAATMATPEYKAQQAKAVADFRTKMATPEYKAQQAKQVADYKAKMAATMATPEYKAQQVKQAADYKAKIAAERATPEYKAKEAKQAADYKAKMAAKMATPEYQAQQAKQLADYKAKHGVSYTQAMAKENAAKKAKEAGMKISPQKPVMPSQQEYGFDGGGGGGKAGGRVKKMASGGFARAADGVAKKGKTQGKVVKMASGGFVKTADGCAQRGKTKAFQVKMNRGGRC